MQAVIEGAIQQLVSFVPKPGMTLLQLQLMDGAGRTIDLTAMNSLRESIIVILSVILQG